MRLSFERSGQVSEERKEERQGYEFGIGAAERKQSEDQQTQSNLVGECNATKVQRPRRNEEQCCHYGPYILTSHAELLKIELVSVYCLLKVWNFSGKVKSGESKRMRKWPIPNVIEAEIRLTHLALFYVVQKPIAAADEPKLAHLQQWTASERCQKVSTAAGEFRFQLFT
ncbi:MAG: hypothetical protein MJY92_06465 [Bacteroidales bacterium]|nr:hypothetical protein [Bacteroidales bacterium]